MYGLSCFSLSSSDLMMRSRTSLSTASLLVRVAIRFLLKTFPTTLSNDPTWGLSVKLVLMLEVEGDWRGVLCTVFVVKDTKGEVLIDGLELDLPFLADRWLMLGEV